MAFNMRTSKPSAGNKFYNNGRWWLGSSYKFRGCIVNPAVGKVIAQESSQSSVKKSIDEIAKEVIRGDYGNGEVRRKALGSYYDEVQKQVNQNFKHGTTRWDNIKLY